jgi:hypothetical protein
VIVPKTKKAETPNNVWEISASISTMELENALEVRDLGLQLLRHLADNIVSQRQRIDIDRIKSAENCHVLFVVGLP